MSLFDGKLGNRISRNSGKMGENAVFSWITVIGTPLAFHRSTKPEPQMLIVQPVRFVSQLTPEQEPEP